MFPFDYIRKAFINVMLDGVALEYPKDYTINSKQLEFTTAPSANTIIEIYRKTPSTRLASFEDSSVLRAKDLNIFEVQLLHRTEETEDAVQEGGLAIDPFDEAWDGRYKRIKNVATPINAQDAVNLQYVEDTKTGTSSDRIKAEQAALTATSQATIATTKAGEASISASDALSYKNTAVSASGTATLAKNAAVAAQTASETARDQSVAAKDSSQGSAVVSEDWAKKAQEAAGIASGIPTGTIIAWGGLTAPAGYLECVGQVLKRDIYKGLFNAIGTVWGSNSEDDFKLPDFKTAARFLRSRGDGLEVGTVQGDAIRNIVGTSTGTIDEAATATGALYKIPVSTLGSTRSVLDYGLGFDAAKAPGVLVADENRPKSAVVMYCIKAVDEYINPAQVDMAKVAEAVALKADRDEVKELAGTRLWVSGEYTPIANTPTIVSHGLNIDPLKCKCDVLLKCVIAEGGYVVGDYAMGLSVGIETTINEYDTLPPSPFLSTSTIQLNTGNGFIAKLRALQKNTGMPFTATLANWCYVFRIWH